MAVDAIGSTLGSSANINEQNSLSQNDFIKLFLTELQFQDPLEPINNREFLAQMAQFANLEQARQTTESLSNLVFMNSTAQSVALIGRTVTIAGDTGQATETGKVTSVQFTQSGPLMNIITSGPDSKGIPNVRLSQIVRVADPSAVEPPQGN